MEQAGLFDIAEGERLKQAGMADAIQAARVARWKEAARAAIDTLAAVPGHTFTADDVIAAVGLPDHGPNRNNAVGAIMAAAGKRGVIAKTGHYAKSRRPAGHARMVAVWIGRA